MVIIMDMGRGIPIREPDEDPEAYDEEVLNASWLPRPEPGLQLQQVAYTRPEHDAPPPEDVDAFLDAVYRYQE